MNRLPCVWNLCRKQRWENMIWCQDATTPLTLLTLRRNWMRVKCLRETTASKVASISLSPCDIIFLLGELSVDPRDQVNWSSSLEYLTAWCQNFFLSIQKGDCLGTCCFLWKKVPSVNMTGIASERGVVHRDTLPREKWPLRNTYIKIKVPSLSFDVLYFGPNRLQFVECLLSTEETERNQNAKLHVNSLSFESS